MTCPDRVYTAKGSWDCGVCRICRYRKSREWGLRMYHEWKVSGYKALFVLLTYDNKHLPPKGLCRDDLTKYLKRLRRALDYREPGRKIKVFCSGEYGTRATRRPHYHLIIFGASMADRELIYNAWRKCENRPGCFGCRVVHGKRAFEYTAGYVRKKIGRHYNHIAKLSGSLPEYAQQSRGIGKEWLLKYGDTTPYLRVDGRKILKPRYYRRLLGITQEDFADYIKDRDEEVLQAVIARDPSAVTYWSSPDTGDVVIYKTPKYWQILKDSGRAQEMRMYYSEMEWQYRKYAV